MDANEFYKQLDGLDASFKCGVLSAAQYSTECVLLGWKWHKLTGKGLPARPLGPDVRSLIPRIAR